MQKDILDAYMAMSDDESHSIDIKSDSDEIIDSIYERSTPLDQPIHPPIQVN